MVGEVERPEISGLEASMSFVRVAMLGGAHLKALPVKPLQVDEQVGAVAFDRALIT